MKFVTRRTAAVAVSAGIAILTASTANGGEIREIELKTMSAQGAVDKGQPASGITFGRGYDSVSGKLMNTCITGDVPRITASQSGKFNSVGYIETDASDTARHSSMSLAGSFGYGIYSGSASFSTVTSDEVSASSTTAVMDAVYESPVFPLTNVQIKQPYKGMNPVEFRANCGDTFVSGAFVGAEYQARISIQSTNEDDLESTRAAMQASAVSFNGSAGISAEQTQSLETKLSTHRNDFNNLYVGDDPTDHKASSYCGNNLAHMPENIPEMTKFASTLSCRSKISPIVIAWSTDPYPKEVATPVFREDDDVQKLMALYERMEGLKSAADQNNIANYCVGCSSRHMLKEASAIALILDDLYSKYLKAIAKGAPHQAVAEFESELNHWASSVAFSPRLLHLYRPAVNRLGPIFIDKFSDDYQTLLTFQGVYAWDGNDRVSHVCPPNCPFGASALEFVDESGNQTIKDISATMLPLRVQAGDSVYFIGRDDPQNDFGDNIFPDGSGILRMDDFDNQGNDLISGAALLNASQLSKIPTASNPHHH